MRPEVLRELKRSFLLFLWLLLGQFAAAALLTMIAIPVLVLGAFGVIPLVGRTPLWEWIAGSVLICLSWFAMGRSAPRAVRPGPVGAVGVLTVWAILTSSMHTVYLLFLPQAFCGGILEQIFLLWGLEFWTAERWAMTIACFQLSAAVGIGLHLGRKDAAGAGHDGERR